MHNRFLVVNKTCSRRLVRVAALCILLIVYLVEQAPAQERMKAPTAIKQWGSIPLFSKATQVNVHQLPIRVDIKKAIELSVHCLNSQFDRDHDDDPYFYCQRLAEGTGEMRHAVEIGIPHVVGRSLLGTVMSEVNAGVPHPLDGYAIYKRYAEQMFDNPDNLNSFYKDGKRGIELHNMREGLWSLWALIKEENSAWARQKAHSMLETLQRITDSTGKWSNQLALKNGLAPTGGFLIDNQSRMIDPLMAYYELTKDDLALTLAKSYAHIGLDSLFESDGQFAPFGKSSGHIHSLTSSLSGITRYAIFSNNKSMIEKCMKIMDKGVPEYFSTWGWGDEVMPAHPANVISQGEINQTGDVVRTALYLGAAGHTRYYELAERYLRSMLLPAQLWQSDIVKFLKQNPNPKDDSEKDVINRSTGGYGFTLPDARMRNTAYPVETQDITSGAVHALAECWKYKSTSDQSTISVNLLFDAATNDVLVKSYLPLEGKVDAQVLVDKSFAIRIPDWVNKSGVKVYRNGKLLRTNINSTTGYLMVDNTKKGDKISLVFDVPCRTEQEVVDGLIYSTTWIGNQVISINKLEPLSKLPF